MKRGDIIKDNLGRDLLICYVTDKMIYCSYGKGTIPLNLKETKRYLDNGIYTFKPSTNNRINLFWKITIGSLIVVGIIIIYLIK